MYSICCACRLSWLWQMPSSRYRSQAMAMSWSLMTASLVRSSHCRDCDLKKLFVTLWFVTLINIYNTIFAACGYFVWSFTWRTQIVCVHDLVLLALVSNSLWFDCGVQLLDLEGRSPWQLHELCWMSLAWTQLQSVRMRKCNLNAVLEYSKLLIFHRLYMAK